MDVQKDMETKGWKSYTVTSDVNPKKFSRGDFKIGGYKGNTKISKIMMKPGAEVENDRDLDKPTMHVLLLEDEPYDDVSNADLTLEELRSREKLYAETKQNESMELKEGMKLIKVGEQQSREGKMEYWYVPECFYAKYQRDVQSMEEMPKEASWVETLTKAGWPIEKVSALATRMKQAALPLLDKWSKIMGLSKAPHLENKEQTGPSQEEGVTI